MKLIEINKIALLSCVLTIGALTGCAAPQKPLYSWGSYQKEVYGYLKNSGTSAQEQIITLEQQEQKVKADGSKLPPGFDAHLGMLYANVGKYDKAQQKFESEKGMYPESAAYMDFLLNNMNKK